MNAFQNALVTQMPVLVCGVLTATSRFRDTGIRSGILTVQPRGEAPTLPDSPRCTLQLSLSRPPFPWCLTFFLLLPLGLSVLILALLLQDILYCPLRKLLPSWEDKGLGVVDLMGLSAPRPSKLRPVSDGAP